ncbi:universal stress protein [Candidatus Nitrososphaera sp. FF02]|uniref:universal stress protein n=1 Tax=Candidatus Nitrososphaera sp. FF02 TaxID=3398226 RepID=UPI0039EA5106
MAADFSKILVAVDESAHAEKAFRHAMAIAQKFGSKVTVVHVMSAPAAGGGMGHFPVQEAVRTAVESADGLAQKFSALAKQEFGLAVETRTAKGAIADEILKAASSEHATLIVMGSRGLTGIKELMLGSVSSAVVHKSKVPVLTVK